MKNHKVEIDKKSRTSSKKHGFFNSPTQIIFFSYVAVIFIGGLLLFLPISQKEGRALLPFLDCLFTATSAVCVTGLVVVPTVAQWTLFGQVVILVLIQVGGLSIIAITSFIVALAGRKIGFKDRLLLQNTLNQNYMGGVVKRVKNVIKLTLLAEATGATILGVYFYFSGKFGAIKSIYVGIFHAVSAFCNAGFDILEVNSLQNYSADFVVNFVLIFLIVGGGIGFMVIEDIIEKIKNKRHRVSVSSRLAIYTTLILIVSAMVFFFISEYNNPETIGGFTTYHKLLASLFQSVTMRTAGFSSLDQYGLKESSKIVASFFMLIGASPGGMAGGIKTVTIAIIFNSIWSIVKGREGIIIMNRSIPLKTLQKSLAVAGLMTILLFLTTLMLCVSEAGSIFKHSFIDIMYECASALSTTGLSTGITPFLTNFGKTVLIISMIVGRVGPITAIYALTQPENKINVKLPEVDVLIG